MKNSKTEKLYRVFLTRHYIAVDYMEVLSTTPEKAATRVKKWVSKTKPDVRAIATDNHWQTDEPVTIECVGQFGSDGSGRHPMIEVESGLYEQPEKETGTK